MLMAQIVGALPIPPAGSASVSEEVNSIRSLTPGDTAASAAAVPDSLASVTTDTGAFASGPTGFTHFTVPGLCAAMAQYTSIVQRQSASAQAELDTIRTVAPTHDTLPASAITVAQRCGTRFAVAETPPAELTDLFTLALQSNNDALAHAVVERKLTLASTAAARDTVLLAAIGGYLAAEPARVSAAEAVVAKIDARGPTAQVLRLTAHDSLLAFASAMYDPARMRQEAERLIALGHEVPTDALKYDYDPIVRAYEALAALVLVEHPDSVAAVARQAKQDLGRFPPGNAFPAGKPYSGGEALDYKTASLDEIVRELSPLGGDQLVVGQAPAPLQATYWFPKPAHWPPGNGPVSLVVYAGHGPCLGGINGWEYSYSCGLINLGAGVHTALARYAARGPPVTIVLEIWSTALGQLPSSVMAQADTLRWYYRTHLHLPVTVAVVADSMQQLPAPDGRLFPCNADGQLVCWDRSPNAQRYLSRNNPVVLLGREGQLLYSGPFEYGGGHPQGFVPLFDAMLNHILGASAVTPSTASAPSPGTGGTDVTR